MRMQSLVVFDDFIAGGATIQIYTPAEFNEVLGMYDDMVVHGIADQVASSGFTDYTVEVEHSGDNRNWVTKDAALWDNATLTANTTLQKVGNDQTATLAFARIRITVAGSTGQFHLKLIVTQRDSA